MPENGRPVVAARGTAEDGGPRRAPVTHAYATLTFLTDGRSRMEQNGEWSLGAGDVFLVPAGQAHRALERHRSEFWGLSFCVPCFAAEGAATFLEPFERVRDGASAVVRIPAERHAFLEGLFVELEESGRMGSGEALDVVQRSLLTLVLNEVAKAASAEAPVRARVRGSGVVVDSLRFIERNCLRKLTLDDVAHAVGRTPAYVTSALKNATGRSAGEWILSGRMAEARRLLLHSDERVDVVGERVGYADATHFIRMFRRSHGATPAAWRAGRRR